VGPIHCSAKTVPEFIALSPSAGPICSRPVSCGRLCVGCRIKLHFIPSYCLVERNMSKADMRGTAILRPTTSSKHNMGVPEFIAYAKANPDKINMASPGSRIAARRRDAKVRRVPDQAAFHPVLGSTWIVQKGDRDPILAPRASRK
jgi:hypothetical protein